MHLKLLKSRYTGRLSPPQLGLRTEWRGSHTLGKSKTTANKSYRHPRGSCMHGPCSHSFLFMALGRNGQLTGIWRNTKLTSHIFRNKFHFIAISACAFPGISAWPFARYIQKCTQQQKWQNSPKVWENSKLSKGAHWKVAILTKMAIMAKMKNLANIRQRFSENANEIF